MKNNIDEALAAIGGYNGAIQTSQDGGTITTATHQIS